MKMCRSFANLGLDVTLLTTERPAQSEVHEELPHPDPFGFYGVPPVFTLKKLAPRPGRPKLVALYKTWRGEIERIRPDFAYGRDLLAVYAASRAGVPCALELHMPLSVQIAEMRPHMRLLFRYMLSRLACSPSYRGTVVISGALKNAVSEDTPILQRKPLLIAHDGADDREASAAVTKSGPLKVGYFGHLYPGKGMERIADLAKALPTLPEVELHVFGGMEQDILRWQSMPVTKNVRFHGHLPHSEVSRRQYEMDILLAPYQRNVGAAGGGGVDIGRYMSPLKLFEYMAAGKPIICSDLPVLREILDETCAIMVPPDNGDAWVVAIRKLGENRELRESLGRNARERFLKHYTWDKRAEYIARSFGMLGPTTRVKPKPRTSPATPDPTAP